MLEARLLSFKAVASLSTGAVETTSETDKDVQKTTSRTDRDLQKLLRAIGS